MSDGRKLFHNGTAEFLIFTGQAGEQRIEARYEDETVWRTQKLMACSSCSALGEKAGSWLFRGAGAIDLLTNHGAGHSAGRMPVRIFRWAWIGWLHPLVRRSGPTRSGGLGHRRSALLVGSARRQRSETPKRAEFLVWQSLDWTLIRGIAVLNPAMKQRVEGILDQFPQRLRRKVAVKADWHY